MVTRVLLVDDHEIMREGLCALLNRQNDIEVIGAVMDGREAVETALKTKPDIVVMDIAMPGLNGIEATKQIVHQLPETKVIALSAHTDKHYVADMLKAGAVGYLVKRYAFSGLLDAIHTTRAGQIYLSPGVVGIVVEDYVQHLPLAAASPKSVLTAREREVLQLIAEGYPTKKIGALLHVSIQTVATHRRQIMSKLGVLGIADLTKYAVREGFTSLDS